MKPQKFLVGDEIVCNVSFGEVGTGGYRKGGIYKVKEIREDTGPSNLVMTIRDDNDSEENGWGEQFFDHADPELNKLWKLLNEI